MTGRGENLGKSMEGYCGMEPGDRSRNPSIVINGEKPLEGSSQVSTLYSVRCLVQPPTLASHSALTQHRHELQ